MNSQIETMVDEKIKKFPQPIEDKETILFIISYILIKKPKFNISDFFLSSCFIMKEGVIYNEISLCDGLIFYPLERWKEDYEDLNAKYR